MMSTQLINATTKAKTADGKSSDIGMDVFNIHNNGSFIAKCAMNVLRAILKAVGITDDMGTPVVLMFTENGKRRTILCDAKPGLTADEIIRVLYANEIVFKSNAETDFSDEGATGNRENISAWDMGLKNANNISDAYRYVPLMKTVDKVKRFFIIDADGSQLIDY